MESSLSLSVRFLIIVIRLYQRCISPFMGAHCRFFPTCSNYGIEALRLYGICKGSYLIIKRLLKCHPMNTCGEDQISIHKLNTREH